jgi:hypothetical protein
VSLSKLFNSAPNLGVIATKWYAELEKKFDAAGIKTSVKTGIDGAASLLSPAALIAQLIKLEGCSVERPIRVLMISDDPVAVMDEGVWLGVAAELAGAPHVECFSTCHEVLHSSLFECATQLGLKGYSPVSVEDAGSQPWDLAVWVHPALEAGASDELVRLVKGMYSAGVPVYACMYNELDALIQSHGLNPEGLEFSWLNGTLASTAFSRSTVNKFGYSTSEVGIEGGWGAVLTKVQPASLLSSEADWECIKVAMGLFKLDGSTSGPWTFGQVVAGVAFNQHQPVGLIGNLAVDPKTGVLLKECPNTKVLMVIGHLWSTPLQTMPKGQFELVPWAARVRLLATNNLTKEDKKRAESIDLLTRAYESGMVEAGIALARGYEAIGTTQAKGKAAAIYEQMGAGHPMSAYYLAHQYLGSGNRERVLSLLTAASEQGYVPAITDLGCLRLDDDDLQSAIRLFESAERRGDGEASFRLGEIAIKAGEYDAALQKLRSAWGKGHQDALNTAHWLCSEMLNHGLGKPGRLKRELKEIKFAIGKRVRYENQTERASA